MIHTDGTPTIAHRASDDVLAAGKQTAAQSPHARTRDLLVSLIEDELPDATVVLSRVDDITFAFTDGNGERWDVRVSRH